MSKHIDTTPIEVYILTADYDIKGTVYVAKYTDSNRELTDLLNDKERRFLAVTNAEILPRNSSQAPRRYNFLEVHMDYVLMVHPISQALFKEPTPDFSIQLIEVLHLVLLQAIITTHSTKLPVFL